MKLPDIDLLRLLLMLYQYRSTTKVAERLFTSQSSVSRSLQKLRDHFDDELFIRQPSGLQPTAKAEYLATHLPDVISQLEAILFDKIEFAPHKLDQTIHLAVNAFFVPALGEKLFERLQKVAPQAKLFIEDWGPSTIENLLSGQIDMGINYYPLNVSKQLLQRKVTQDHFVMLMHKNHPLDVEEVTVEDAVQYPMVQVIVNDFNEDSYTNEAIVSQGLESNIKLKSSNLMLLLNCLQDQKMLMPSSGMFASSLGDEYRSIPLADYPTNPAGDIGLFLPNKFAKNPFHSWLISEVEQVLKSPSIS
ncbi:LysR family transcriptional regulator [Vibrio sp. CK2-1]|uniref:LysR family transcriptional regulator n=1 Tax=Vibrio sp. CK2-1 TaxID=2912249 RepID=UPI001F3B90E7|nr:LysR family transcriptional regulator [Vibrio sp. CK2-1]MCF7354420.1 LysR family transcriptional regulator [Vibrio sp. CK2-1]